MKLKIIGKQIPSGTVAVSGAKNSATRLLAAALLASEPVRIRNFPTELVDARAKMDFIRKLGGVVEVNEELSQVEVSAKELGYRGVDSYALEIRTTYLLAAATLARIGVAQVPYPGGCKIGSRGYDLHMMVWRDLGCVVQETNDFIKVEGSLKGGLIDFPISTVGGTENALLCSSVADGVTEIRNAYITPEVYDLITLLREMGVKIETTGNSLIRVQGENGLLRGASHKVMPDRIEALTWIIFAVLTGGNVTVVDVPFADLEVPLIHLRDIGIDVFRNARSVAVSEDCINSSGIQPFELACGTHPGIISDMQPFFTLLGMKAKGKSRIFDYRYPERIAYATELGKFCSGSIESELGKITTSGVARLKGCNVQSTDLRGSMALVMAGFFAEGETVVNDVQMALRGYNNLMRKLKGLGLIGELTP